MEGDFRLEVPNAGAAAAAAPAPAADVDEDDFRLDLSASSAQPPQPAAEAAAAPAAAAAVEVPPAEVVEQVSFIGQHTDSALLQLEKLERLVDSLSENTGCPICNEAMNTAERVPYAFPCGHVCCLQCARENIARRHACPTCRSGCASVEQLRRVYLQQSSEELDGMKPLLPLLRQYINQAKGAHERDKREILDAKEQKTAAERNLQDAESKLRREQEEKDQRQRELLDEKGKIEDLLHRVEHLNDELAEERRAKEMAEKDAKEKAEALEAEKLESEKKAEAMMALQAESEKKEEDLRALKEESLRKAEALRAAEVKTKESEDALRAAESEARRIADALRNAEEESQRYAEAVRNAEEETQRREDALRALRDEQERMAQAQAEADQEPQKDDDIQALEQLMEVEGLTLDKSIIPPPDPPSGPFGNLVTWLRGFVTSGQGSDGSTTVQKTIETFTLGECGTESPDEIVIRGTKDSDRALYGMKYVQCDPIFAQNQKDKQKDQKPKIYYPEHLKVFLEPYILYTCSMEAIVPIKGIVTCPKEADFNETWKAWKSRLHIQDGPGFLIQLQWTENDLQFHAATGRVTASHAQSIACQLFEALSHLHGNGIVHRAVAPYNIRVLDGVQSIGSYCAIYLAGFYAACNPESQAVFILSPPPACSYSAPEMFSREYDSQKSRQTKEFWKQCDVWSAACIVAELLVGTRGRPLFNPRILRLLNLGGADALRALKSSHPGLYARYPILGSIRSIAPEDPSHSQGNFAFDVEDLCMRMSGSGSLDPQTRALARLMTSILVADPAARPSAEAVASALNQGQAAWSGLRGVSKEPLKTIDLNALLAFSKCHCSFLY